MANTCARLVYACSLRVARLTSDGSLDTGADGLYVSDALATIGVAFNTEEGEEFTVKNGCGELCLNVKGCDQLKRLDLTMALCYPDPELLEMLINGVVLTSGAAVGWGVPHTGSTTCPNGVSVEFWSKRYDSSGSQEAAFPYQHYVLPRTYWSINAHNFENGPVTTELSGFAIENDQWGAGPDGDWTVASDRALQSLPETTLPTPVCSYQTLAS